jgi:uncharacterized membrane protein
LLATTAVAGVAALDLAASTRSTAAEGKRESASRTHLRAFATIRCEPQVAYEYWRNFENFPQFMAHVESVQVSAADRSTWRVKGPAGIHLEWDAEIIRDDPGSVISWRTLPGSTVSHSGGVRFRPAPRDQGTEVSLDIVYGQPGGRAGELAAKLLGEQPRQQVADDLRRFKQLIEAGSITRSDASPDGTTAHRQLRQRPGQPVADSAPTSSDSSPNSSDGSPNSSDSVATASDSSPNSEDQ